MANELVISKATSLHFEIMNGPDTIMQGQYPDGNYRGSTISEYFNCDLDDIHQAQKFNCDDVTGFQFKYVKANSTPLTVAENDAGVPIQIWDQYSLDSNPAYNYPGPGGEIYEVDINFDDNTIPAPYPCPGCVEFRIISVDSSINLFTDGEDGTFENPGAITNMQTGGANAISQSNTVAYAGTFSLKCEAPITPAAAEKTICYGDTLLTFTAGQYYIAVAQVYSPTSNKWVSGLGSEFISIKPALISGSFIDADIFAQQIYTPLSDGYDNWFQLVTVFKVNTDTTGKLAIASEAIPNANGLIYVDNIQIFGQTVIEAISEKITLETNHPCTLPLRYIGETDQFRIRFNNNYQQTQMIRVGINETGFRMDDGDYETQLESNGEENTIVSFQRKIYEAKTEVLSMNILEKLALALKFDTVTLNGRQITCVSKSFTIERNSDSDLFGIGSFEFVPTVYNYQNSNC